MILFTLPFHQSARSQPTRHPLPALRKATKRRPSKHIHREYGETLEKSKHSKRFILEIRSSTINSSREKIRTNVSFESFYVSVNYGVLHKVITSITYKYLIASLQDNIWTKSMK
jgi:hypothetical protein